MSNYTKATNFTAKDSLTTGDPGKLIKGSEIDAEYTAIATAITSKADTASPTFTGTPLAPTAVSTTNTTQIATTAFVQTAKTAILNAIYPVGSIYTNATNATNPSDSTLLGFGTWVAFGEGRVAIGNGGGFTAGATGGSADAIVVSHSHTASSSSSVDDPGHVHPLPNGVAAPSGNEVDDGGSPGASKGDTLSAVTNISVTTTTTVNSTGSSGTNANLQPYIVVYMWRRTA